MISFSYDLEGNFTSFNKAAERLVGYSREEIFRMNISDLATQDSLPAVQQTIADVFNESRGTHELGVIRKNGQRLVLRIMTKLVRAPGRRPEIHCLVFHIAGSRQLETSRLEASLEDLEREIGAHDSPGILRRGPLPQPPSK